jgi:hypothetical protein
MIVGMCLVAGTAWAQSGPKASPKQVASPNQPQPTTANTNIATANSKKLKQPTFAARWTAVTTQQVIGQWFVTPINPNSAGAKLTKGSALLADIQSGPNGFYTFPAFTQDAPVNHYAQLELSVKPGRKYDIKCYTVMDWPRGYKTKVSLGEYVNGRAANVTPIDNPMGVTSEYSTVDQDKYWEHTFQYTSTKTGPVYLRFYRRNAGNATPDDVEYNKQPASFFGCHVREVGPVTTMQQGDKA